MAKVTVEGEDLEDVAEAVDLHVDPPHDVPEELESVVEDLERLREGLIRATRENEGGRSRSTVRRYAELDEYEADDIAHMLRVLEVHGVAAQDGHSWRYVGEG